MDDKDWNDINNDMIQLRIKIEKYPPSREVSLTKTKLDECILWWQSERGFLTSIINNADLKTVDERNGTIT